MATTEGLDILADLVAEQRALDAIVAPLDDARWLAATPSPGWTVADQIGHLTYFDRTARLALTDPDAFADHRRNLVAIFADPGAVERETLGEFRSMAAHELLAAWRAGRGALADAAARADAEARVEWYGPSMSLRSFLTARLMETWAHGQDVVDAVGGDHRPSDRLRHVAQLGVITRGWSYRNRGLDPPVGEVRVELTAPSGAEWTWGPERCDDVVAGPAEDFCLVVTQRRHVDDTRLAVSGTLAREWMERAQAFAGPATDGPATRSAP
jgi:uncharacterized protein (TIGR03084 family)